MVSVRRGIGLPFEINAVGGARDEERIGQGCVDLSTVEGHMLDEIDDEHHPHRATYIISES